MKTFKPFTLLLLMLLCGFILPGTCPALDITTSSRFIPIEDQQVISMDFKDANLNDVLKVFSQQSGMNFIAETSISSLTVNLYLDEVPVEEALERILSANGLTYEMKPGSNIFVVKQLAITDIELMTRVYPLKNASVSSSKIFGTLSSLSGSLGEDGSGESSSAASSETTSSMLESIQNILTSNGSIVEDPRTNSLIITDIPSQFRLIENTIAQLDVRVPQILIEAEMLDISKNSSDLLGAKFGNTPLTFNGAQRDDSFPFNDTVLEEKNFVFEEPQYRVSTLDFSGLTIALQFLRTQTDTKNLARPHILTLNNETALIQIKTDEAIGISNVADAGTDLSTEEAERVPTGVFLKVTPQANLYSGEITMAIEPKVVLTRPSNIDSRIRDPEERATKSILRIRDGDTIVIGGLLRSSLDKTITKVPVLGSIPILGAAFRHKDKAELERELIVFITPHILKDDYMPNQPLTSKKYLEREQRVPRNKYREVNQELSNYSRQR